MRILKLSALLLLIACSTGTERIKEPTAQQNNSQVQKIVDLAEKLVEQRRKAQPISWDVSLDESMAKENPFTPPNIVLNSGRPPSLGDFALGMGGTKAWRGIAGLWNCQKLEAGSSFCDSDSRKHMRADNYMREAGGKITGQVTVSAVQHQGMAAACMESAGMTIRLFTTHIVNAHLPGFELRIGFDDEPSEAYGVNPEIKGLVIDSKSLLKKLMKDHELLEIRIFDPNVNAIKSTQMVVKNFPEAWATVCGWHVDYDAITGFVGKFHGDL